jgi:hypothetical protein
MAAQMVSSAVAQEAVSQALSKLKERYGHKSDGKEHMERMEMAHIKLEAALETSNKWNVTSVPLLRWQSKLKRAAQECDHTLRRCKQRMEEEEERQHWVRRFAFPKLVAHTARSFVSSFISRGDDDELTGSTVHRFERFADGASEFLRYVELGGTPHQYMFFDPMIRHLLSGKGTKYCSVHGGQHLSFLLHPFSPPEHGMEGMLIFLLEDGNAPENNFFLSLSLRLSESINIVGVAVRCLQLFTPHLSSTAETVKTKLTQLPTHDFCWMQDAAYSVFGRKEYWDNLHTIRWKLFEPTPVCRQQQDRHYEQRYDASRKSSSSESLPCDVYLEPVTQVHLLGHIALLAGDNRQNAVANGKTCSTRESPFLKLGGHLWPHASSEDMLPAVGGSATEMINREVTPCGLYANISFDQLGEIMVPKAEDCLGRNVAASLYQMLWKSKHGSAYLQAEKTSWPPIPSGLKLKGRGAKNQKQSRSKKVMHPWISETNEFMSSWILHAPAHVQASFVNWVENETPPLLLPLSSRITSCVHDCPIKSLSLPDWHTSSARKIRSSSTFIALRT